MKDCHVGKWIYGYIIGGISMFNNIGSKIKIYAEVVSWIGIIICVIFGIILIISGVRNESADSIFSGLLITLIGSLFCWISSFVLYGFGQLVENSDILVKTLAPNFKEDLKDIKEISKDELEKITKEIFSSDWNDRVKDLSNEELQERIDNEDWQYEYRILCKKELESRK